MPRRITENMVEPLFVRGAVVKAPKDDPLKIRWVVQWQSREGVEAHKTFEHHKAAAGRFMPLINMDPECREWGGGLEYDLACNFGKAP